MRTLVTPPQPEADRWVIGLRDLGIDTIALPLIDIAQTHGAALEAARSGLPTCDAVMFVSPTAVEAFFAEHVRLIAPMPTRFLATGPGTVRALRLKGVEAASVDAPPANAARFDSEALWDVIGSRVWQDKKVLLVRGEGETGSRDWLAQQFQQAGAKVGWVTAYERRLPQWTSAQIELTRQACTDGSLWLFSSSQAVLHLLRLCPDLPWSAASCLCTHERIALTARKLGFTRVMLCRPTLEEVATICHAQSQPWTSHPPPLPYPPA
jgi:uroporphyrinogen-III synthase